MRKGYVSMDEGLTTDTAVSQEADSSDKDENEARGVNDVESGIQSSDDEEVAKEAGEDSVSFAKAQDRPLNLDELAEDSLRDLKQDQ